MKKFYYICVLIFSIYTISNNLYGQPCGSYSDDETITTSCNGTLTASGNGTTITFAGGGTITLDNITVSNKVNIVITGLTTLKVTGTISTNNNFLDVTVNSGSTLDVGTLDMGHKGNTIISGSAIIGLITGGSQGTLDIADADFVDITICDIDVDYTLIEVGDDTASGDPCAFLEDVGVVLPIELIFLSASEENNGAVTLNWATASEENNDYFEIQRSADGKIFETIGSVDGFGNSLSRIDYSFTDENPLAGKTTYRLKQVDFDGKYEFFTVSAGNNTDKALSIISKSRNPLYEGDNLNLEIYAPQKEMLWIQVYNMQGKVLYQERVSVQQGYTTLPIESKYLTSKAMLLKVTGGFKNFTQKILKY